MVTKPTKEFTDAFGRRKIKGNMDIELAIDVMEMSEHVDHIIIFSGDGDFRRLVEAVQRKGVRVSVVSTMRSSPPMVADELRRQADNFIELQDLMPHIARAAPITSSRRLSGQCGHEGSRAESRLDAGADPGRRLIKHYQAFTPYQLKHFIMCVHLYGDRYEEARTRFVLPAAWPVIKIRPVK